MGDHSLLPSTCDNVFILDFVVTVFQLFLPKLERENGRN